jgi:hypothetical protein
VVGCTNYAYTTTATLTTAPTDFEIAKGIGCENLQIMGVSLYFFKTKTGNNCSSSNSDFSFTINDIGNCGPLYCNYWKFCFVVFLLLSQLELILPQQLKLVYTYCFSG